MDFAHKQTRVLFTAVIVAAVLSISLLVVSPAYAAGTTRTLTTTAATEKATQGATTTAKTIPLYRVHNPRTGEHLYTKSVNEKRVLVMKKGWRFEGVAWYSPTKGDAVYRLYKDGAHHYTSSVNERNILVRDRNWIDEGICWFSDDKKTVPVYRVVKPGAALVRAHHYTTSKNENDTLIRSRGWKSEGVGWYASKKGQDLKDGWVRQHGAWTYWLEGKQQKATWIETVQTPEADSDSDDGIQRYWIDADGKLAQSRIINPSASRDKKAGQTAYATWSGAMLRGKAALSNGTVILADKKTGKLATGKGFVTTSAYDSSSQRYYLVSKGAYSIPKTGLFTINKVKYYGWPDEGYIMRNSEKYMGKTWYKADKNGKLTVSKTSRTTHINRYVNWAVKTANDNSHGYSQYTRWGPDYDCSSLVISSLKAAGFNVGTATYTGNMRAQLTKYGFKWYGRSQLGKIDRGDILLNEVHHTAIYLGNGKQVAATISEKGTIYGKKGDQTGREITTQNYFDYPWNGFLRYVGK